MKIKIETVIGQGAAHTYITAALTEGDDRSKAVEALCAMEKHFLASRKDRQQLPPPAPQDVQPEGQRVGEWAEARVLAMPMFGKSAHVFQGPIRYSVEEACVDEVVWRVGLRQQPVAAGAPLGGASDEELEKRFSEILASKRAQCLGIAPFAVQLAREAVAAERERCARIVLNRPMSGEMSSVLDKIRSGG